MPEMHRTLTPELLDSLPPEDRNARQSRRDLRYINAIMGNERWFRQTLPPLVRPGERVLELGAGDGKLCRKLHRRLPAIDAIDLCPAPSDWPKGSRWHQEDMHQFTAWQDYPIVIGNLIFHHFDDATLALLGQHISQHARVIMASEPVRHPRYQKLFALLCFCIRANPVTRHDGHVSIAAGFRDEELPRLLQLDPDQWRWSIPAAGRGAYHCLAERRK